MNKIKKCSIIMLILIISILVLIPNKNYASFADLEYPPNSNGKIDYSDEQADKNKTENNENSGDFVGKSSNNNLKSLTVENETLEPSFNRQQVDYKITLKDNNIKKINIKAEAEDSKSKIEGIGEQELKEGINQFKIVVTAENGNVQIYNLKIEMPIEQSNLELEKMEIYGIITESGEKEKIELTPRFEKNIFQYNIKLTNKIDSLIVETKAAEGTYVEIKGTEEIHEGENIVEVTVKDNEEANKKTTYIINAIRENDEIKADKNNSNKKAIIIGMVAILIVIFIIVLIKKRK